MPHRQEIHLVLTLFLLLRGILSFTFDRQGQGLLENEVHCQWDDFNPQCQSDEVLVVNEALYGRMERGKCFEEDFGVLGCHKNVLDYLDYSCSGRTRCSVSVPNAILDKKEPCAEGLESYLDIKYSCLKVEIERPEKCLSSRPIEVRGTGGYLSSDIAQHSGCGSYTAPWRIPAKKGQKVMLHLINFSTPYNAIGEVGVPSSSCLVYAKVREGADTIGKTVCASGKKITHIYTSHGQDVLVDISKQSEENHYLIHYNVTGCATPSFSDAYVVERNGESARVRCRNGKKWWSLTCDGVRWQGERENCTLTPETMVGEDSLTVWTFPLSTGATVAVIIGISLAMGGIILILGIIYLKRNRELEEEAKCNTNMEEMTYGHVVHACGHDTTIALADNLSNQCKLYSENGEYFQTHPCSQTLIVDNSEQYGLISGCEHPPVYKHDERCHRFYETMPKVREAAIRPPPGEARRPSQEAMLDQQEARYFELETARPSSSCDNMPSSARPDRKRPDIIAPRGIYDSRGNVV